VRRRAGLLLVAMCAVAFAPLAHAYLKLGFTLNGRQVSVRWQKFPIRYFVTNRDVTGVSAAQLQTAVQAGFDTWAKTPTVTISSQFAGFTNTEPFVDDSTSVIGFRARPDLERVLGATTFNFDDVTGELIEADIFLNSTMAWSVAASGDPGRFDVQSIATHEIGHLLGFGHSALGETELLSSGGRRVIGKRAIMFPIAFPSGNIEDRTPKPDDLAGLGDIYASSAFNREFGQASGRVTLNGKGLYGAHVSAFNSATGEIVGGFTLDDNGKFVIGGLKPGVYVLRAEPLDDADVSSFFENATVNITFKPAFASKLVAVPAGGASTSVEIKVQSK
jgi:matrixin/carboxypeptidase family protein